MSVGGANGELCSKCRFWQRDGADGLCRFHPPRNVILKMQGGEVLMWPKTNPDDWCGQYSEELIQIEDVTTEFGMPPVPEEHN